MYKSLELSARRVSPRRALLTASSIATLAFAFGPAALGQETPASAPSPTPAAADDARDRTIVVIGDRAIVASMKDVPVEKTYDEDDVASYDESTVGEVLEDIRNENGDDQATVLVNGRPVRDPGDISDLPAEAISRVEALPRGSAQRVGGIAGQRAYNVVLKSHVKSATLTGSYQAATEGGWDNVKGEAILTYVKGQDRINLSVRGADSGNLFESERNVTPYAEPFPYSATGNITPATGTTIDPALNALAGFPVFVDALPDGNTHPTLAQLVPGANQAHPSNQSDYRTLRGAYRPWDVSLSGNKALAPWLSMSFNGRLGWTDGESFSGLPSARFLIPSTNPFTPFTTPVYIALNDPSRPLRGTNRLTNQSLSTTFNADLGQWRASLTGRWDHREQTYVTQSTGSLIGGAGTVATANPFDGSLPGMIPVASRTSHSRYGTTQIVADADGPLFSLWAGPLHARAGASAIWENYHANDTSGARTLDRHEYSARGGVTIPLTSSGATGFLPELGDSELNFDIGTTDLGRFGTLSNHTLAFNWQMTRWLRFVASTARDEQPTVVELLAAPLVTAPNVPYFDPLTGQTVDVTLIYGGAGNLQSQDLRTKTLSWALTPLPKYRVQLNADYVVTDLRNLISGLPPPSSGIVAAFPDRFVRDSSGTLVLVDSRSVNFAQEKSEQLRFGAGFTIPLIQPVTIPGDRKAGTKTRRIPPLNLQVNGSYTILLNNHLLIRPGLPVIDLLEGGALGVGGGQQRHTWNLDVAVSQGGTGFRLSAQNRGVRYLATGTLTNPDLLTYHPITTLNARAFVSLGDMLPHSKLAKGTRISLAVDNLFDKRQQVEDLSGAVPQAYQPVRLDPVGRTVLVELRKVF